MEETAYVARRAILFDLFVLVLVIGAVFGLYHGAGAQGLDALLTLFLAVCLALCLFAWRRWTDAANLMKAMQVESVIDALTAVFNRDYMQKVLQIEAERAGRSGTPLSLMLIDIDGLDEINKRHGNRVGDSVLLAFSGVLTETVRKVDAVGRWEGGTFLIICPDTPAEGAMVAAERLLRVVQRTAFEQAGIVSASIGVTAKSQDDDVDTFIQRAANALDMAKAQGRERAIAL